MSTKVLADSLLCTSQFLRTCEGSNEPGGGGGCCILIHGGFEGIHGENVSPQDLATQPTRQGRGQHAVSWAAAGFTGPEGLVLRVYSLSILPLCSVCVLGG